MTKQQAIMIGNLLHQLEEMRQQINELKREVDGLEAEILRLRNCNQTLLDKVEQLRRERADWERLETRSMKGGE